ncbi:MAG: hypothetical protein ACFFF4_05830 [Candidatus Thorarchaeota archaeon]
MDERSYQYPDDTAPESKKRPLWVIIVTIIAVGLLFPVLIFTSSFDTIPDFFFGFPLDPVTLSVLIFVPMLCILVIVGCGYNAPLTLEEKKEDAKIFESMRLHAAPAEHIEGLDRYRCSECKMSFELHNAEPVDEKVILCPLCGARLFIG